MSETDDILEPLIPDEKNLPKIVIAVSVAVILSFCNHNRRVPVF